MPGTIFGIPFDEELFLDMWREAPDPYLTAMIESGAIVQDSTIAGMIQSNGNIYTIPFYDTLEGDDQNYDGQTDITVEEVGGGFQTGVVYGRSKGFFARNFTAELSGADPMGHIVSTISRFWQKKRQMRMIGIADAVFSITGTSGHAKNWGEKHILDLTSSTADPRKIKETDLNDLAVLACGDHKGEFGLAIMHSSVANTLENLQLLEYRKYTDKMGITRNLDIADINGYTVLIDDGVPVESVGGTGANSDLFTYTTYLFGTGVIRNAKGRVDVPVETVRDAKKNGGQDELITRMRETIHPNGFSFKIPSSGWSQSPTDTQLFNKSNWEIKFDPKAIPMAQLKTNG
ncbi:MAG: hypothetical protein ACRDBM_08675 [Sporomusa sp.]